MIGQALVKRLSSIGELSGEDITAILGLEGKVGRLRKGRDILSVGDTPQFCVVVLKGFLCRHSMRRDGTRQIHSFYMASDAPSLASLHIDYVDNNLGAVETSTIGMVPHSEISRLMAQRPNVLSLIWRDSLIQAAVFREWLTRNSTLPARSALAHFYCEMFVRSEAAGLVSQNSCDVPVTQEGLSHALGLTAVHINRTLQQLRDEGLVEHKNGRLHVYDFDRLAEVGEFDPYYLHFRNGKPPQRRTVHAMMPMELS